MTDTNLSTSLVPAKASEPTITMATSLFTVQCGLLFTPKTWMRRSYILHSIFMPYISKTVSGPLCFLEDPKSFTSSHAHVKSCSNWSFLENSQTIVNHYLDYYWGGFLPFREGSTTCCNLSKFPLNGRRNIAVHFATLFQRSLLSVLASFYLSLPSTHLVRSAEAERN